MINILDFHIMFKICSLLKRGGTVYRLKVGYPVLVEGRQDLVRGQVAQLQLSDIALELMDQLNGFHKLNQQDSLFWRKEIMITTQDQKFKEYGPTC